MYAALVRHEWEDWSGKFGDAFDIESVVRQSKLKEDCLKWAKQKYDTLFSKGERVVSAAQAQVCATRACDVVSALFG